MVCFGGRKTTWMMILHYKSKRMLEDSCVLYWGKKDCVNNDTALEEQQQNVGRLLCYLSGEERLCD